MEESLWLSHEGIKNLYLILPCTRVETCGNLASLEEGKPKVNWEVPVLSNVSVLCIRVQPRKLSFPLYVSAA